jgi:dTDP-glucose pyrophosphorylase
MNIVIPMAGAGSRFVSAGYYLPKPLISIAGQPMYRWAVNSLPLAQSHRLIFIVRRDAYTPRLLADIQQQYAAYKPKILVLESLTRGQAETVLLAHALLDINQPTLIHNADSAFSLPAGSDFSHSFGVLVVFEDDKPRWSYARTNAQGQVLEVREKQVISRYASTGTYYFADSFWLLNTIARMVINDEREQGEFYLAPLYNQAITEGKTISIMPCNSFLCFGTPEDVAHSLPYIEDLEKAQRCTDNTRRIQRQWRAAT